jgi:hypothetical protein
MIVTRKREPNIVPLSLNGRNISIVETHKHLGIVINKDLSRKGHIEGIAGIAYRRLGVLESTSHMYMYDHFLTMEMWCIYLKVFKLLRRRALSRAQLVAVIEVTSIEN